MTDRDPEPSPTTKRGPGSSPGHYENDAMDINIATDGRGMMLAADIKPQIRAAADEELPPGYPREEIGLLPGAGDEYIITSGGMKGMRGFFTRDDSGAVVGIDVGGRMYRRVPTAGQSSPAPARGRWVTRVSAGVVRARARLARAGWRPG